MKTLAKSITPFSIKATDDNSLTFEGLSSTWDLDLGGDIIHPGAFKRTLEHWQRSGKTIPLIDQHNYDSVRAVVGKLVEAKETEQGLWSSWKIIDTEDGREVYARLKGGYIDGLSIGYRPLGNPEMVDGVRHIKELALEEVSVVIWPMNQNARVQSVKAALASLSEEDREEIGALLGLTDHKEAPEPEGLAPEDPERIAAEERFRDLLIRSLSVDPEPEV
jgi:HK97 family phage prohead protease